MDDKLDRIIADVRATPPLDKWMNDGLIDERDKLIAELRAMIELMKSCTNCVHECQRGCRNCYDHEFWELYHV